MSIQMPKPNSSPFSISIRRHVALLSYSSSSHPSVPTSTSPSSLPPLTADDEDVVSSAVSILRHHRSKRRWTLLKSLHPPAALSTAELTHILHRLRNHPRLALRLFLLSTDTASSSSGDYRRRDDPLSFAAVTHVLARHRLRSAALDVLHSAIRSLDPFDSSSGVDDDGRPPEIFRSLANTYRAFDSAPFVFDLLARAYLRSKRLDRALQIVRALRSRRIQPLVGTANALIRLASRTKGSDAGFELYMEIFHSEPGDVGGVRISPNVGTFNTLLLALFREGNLERTKQLRAEMESLGCEPNVFTYSVLMAGFCDEGMIEKAAELFEEMTHRGIPPDVTAFNTLIGGYCEAGEVVSAEEFYKKMISSDVEATATTFQHLVRGHCKVGDVDSGLLLYRDMKRRGYRMEVVALDELLEEMCRKGKIKEGLRILKDEMKREEFTPTRKSYEVLIKGFCEQWEMDDALKVQAEMAGKGYQNSSEVYSAFIRGYKEQGDTEKVMRLQNEMLQMSIMERGEESGSYE